MGAGCQQLDRIGRAAGEAGSRLMSPFKRGVDLIDHIA